MSTKKKFCLWCWLTLGAGSTLPNISHRTIPLNLTAPGTIRIIHPHQRRVQEQGVSTLPRATAKAPGMPGSTLQINISSCGFHTVPSSGDDQFSINKCYPLQLWLFVFGVADGAAQVPTPPEIEDEAINCYEDANVFQSEMSVSKQLPGTSQMARNDSPVLDQDDHDDYRSECENCKSSPGGPSYYQHEEELEPPETMTLQRLPRETDEEPFYRTSLTLPTHCRKPR